MLGRSVILGQQNALFSFNRKILCFRQSPFTVASGRNTLLLLFLFSLLLFSYGFMQLRVFGLPVSELVLILALVTMNHQKAFQAFIKTNMALPMMFWWLVGLASIIVYSFTYGFWAFRDGGHVIESLFFYVGFSLARNKGFLDSLSRMLPGFFILVLAYAMTYPFRDVLIPLSPQVAGTHYAVPLLFTYPNTSMLLITGSAYFLSSYLQNRYRAHLFLSASMIAVALLLFPSRTLILELVVFVTFFLYRCKGKNLARFLKTVGITALMLFIVSLSGISINSRYGRDFSVSQYSNVIMEILPNQRSEKSLTSGTEQRIEWWGDIFSRLGQKPENVLGGLGYGMPLLEHKLGGGNAIREPHNDFVSILARGGLLMLIPFLLFQGIAIYYLRKLVKCLSPDSKYYPSVIGLLFVIFLIWASMLGEPPFIMSFYAVPFYLFLGILLRLYMFLKKGTAGQL